MRRGLEFAPMTSVTKKSMKSKAKGKARAIVMASTD